MAEVATRRNASNGDATDGTEPTSLSPTKRTTRLNSKKQADMTAVDGTNHTPGFEVSGGGEGRGTTLDEVARLIVNLKAIITQQSDTIESLRDEVKEMKAEQQTLKIELESVKTRMTEELKQVHEQLDTIARSQALNIPTNSSPNPSYADVARTPPISQPSNIRTLSSFNTIPSTFTDTLYCIIDTSKTVESGEKRMSAGTVRAAVEKEIRAMDDHADWRCRAVTVDLKNTNRIRIAC
jgi:regulator of replication initiation timing